MPLPPATPQRRTYTDSQPARRTTAGPARIALISTGHPDASTQRRHQQIGQLLRLDWQMLDAHPQA
jgi:hypothetical protein